MKQGFFKRNQKKLLAVFSAGLMIAFALPGNNSNSKSRDVVLGSIGKKDITNKDTAEARAQLEQAREKLQRKDVAILRVEQLYPLADETLQFALKSYPPGTPVFWVQEEPENMGAWYYLRVRFCDRLLGTFPFARISRPASARARGRRSATDRRARARCRG